VRGLLLTEEVLCTLNHIYIVIRQNSSSLNASLLSGTVSETMLSFDLSVIDIVLAIAVVALLLLFLTQRRDQPTTKPELSIGGQKKVAAKPKVPVKSVKETVSTTRLSMDFKECVHHFGYLRNHPKKTPIPDECFGCPKTLRCLFPNESGS